MSQHATQPGIQGPAPSPSRVRDAARDFTEHWYVGIVLGMAWMVTGLAILQFDDASVTTVGVIVGLLFLFAGVQNAAFATIPHQMRWVSVLFAVLFVVAAIVCFVNPADTFAGMADMLGFLFGLVGLWWMIRAFLERPVNPTWWLGLIAGIVMTGLAFWTAGQLFIVRTYVLLVFAGIWALMEGILCFVRAFQLQEVHEDLESV